MCAMHKGDVQKRLSRRGFDASPVRVHPSHARLDLSGEDKAVTLASQGYRYC
jgi:hypothetical protein